MWTKFEEIMKKHHRVPSQSLKKTQWSISFSLLNMANSKTGSASGQNWKKSAQTQILLNPLVPPPMILPQMRLQEPF